MCKLCDKQNNIWFDKELKCAFKNKIFDSDNWRCATAITLRDISYDCELDVVTWNTKKYVTIPVDEIEIEGNPRVLWITWQVDQGKTNTMWLLFEQDDPRKPTEEECLRIIEFYQKLYETKFFPIAGKV